MAMPVTELNQQAELAGVIDSLAAFVQSLEIGLFSGAAAARVTELFARGQRLCETGKAVAARRASECSVPERSGARSPEAWLAGISGTDLRSAQASLTTAEQMDAAPELAEACLNGDLSTDQAAEIADATKADPASAGRLIQQAKNRTLKGLREDCRAVRNQRGSRQDDQGRLAVIHRNRHFRTWVDRDGTGRGSFSMTPDNLARLRAQMHPYEKAAFDRGRQAGGREEPDRYALDALMDMAGAASEHGSEFASPECCRRPSSGSSNPAGPELKPEASSGPSGTRDPLDDQAPCLFGSDQAEAGDPFPAPSDPPAGPAPFGLSSSGGAATAGGCPPTGHPPDSHETSGLSMSDDPGAADGCSLTSDPLDEQPADGPSGSDDSPLARRARRVGPPAMVIAVIDHAALVRGSAEPGESSVMDGIGPVPVLTIEQMMQDAFLAAVVKEDSDIRSVVHLGRDPTAVQRTALIVRDPTCVVPGCDVRSNLEIDHVTGWVPTYRTTLNELARLCRHHHDLKTYEGWRLAGVPGRWQWDPPPGGHRPGPFDDDGLDL